MQVFARATWTRIATAILFSVTALSSFSQTTVPDAAEAKAPPLEFHRDKAFYNDIRKFKDADEASMPPAKSILFIGSSSFTFWKDLADYFPGYKLVNRGFGGSSLPDLIRYQDYIIYPYRPKQIVIYCGENDFGASDTVKVSTVVNRFKQLFWDIRLRLPRVPISYVSMKPSPSRAHLLPKFKEANRQIQDFLATQRETSYIDVYNSMLLPDGRPMGNIFLKDSLHMNAEGYAIWQKKIRPHLKKRN